ncbi:membrane protein [Croceicoccus naphthovorans]|uniref:Membrane protein n=2 Tax=Croceicoccus naphthovorans TaxID=1348774 RepID=A0A0G3XMK6_9SPHN|nr:membrane protein [Croceicoccus naphthovorans]
MQGEHELRRTVVAEMHLRRWPPLRAGMTVIQILRKVDAVERDAEQATLADLPDGANVTQSPNPRHLYWQIDANIVFNWERHSEASATTLFIAEDADLAIAPGGHEHLAPAMEWLGRMPGKIVRATRIAIVADESDAAALLPQAGFEPMDLVSCHIAGGARIWSDYHLRPDGFGLVVVAANGLSGGDLSRTVQRLQELGNYRNLALLGFPVAQAGWKKLDAIEGRLATLGTQVGQPDVTDDALLADVTGLSMELMTEIAASDFRMSATAAYARIVEQRLDDLQIRPCAGFQSLTDFTQRRFLPAVRTCAAHRQRAETLSDRTGQFVALFRTRIETRIENQNGRLLHSMDRSIATQLRMQELVEGLSVVALTYYGVGLIGTMLKGAGKLVPDSHASVISAALVPILALATWLSIRHLKKRVHRAND